MDFEINKTAHKEELYAYLMLSDNLFKNRKVYVGDAGDGYSNLPDLYTEDFKIGVEVTMCERRCVFEMFSKMIGPMKENDFNVNSLKFAVDPVAKFKRAVFKEGHRYLRKKRENNQVYKKGVLSDLEYILTKKLTKLNKGYYNGVKNKYLLVVSDFAKKSNYNAVDYKNLYVKLAKKFDKKFEGVFFLLNEKMYYLNKENVIKRIKNKNLTRKQKNKFHYDPRYTPDIPYNLMKLYPDVKREEKPRQRVEKERSM